MTSDTTKAGQLSIPLGTDAFWLDLASQENGRSVPNVKAETQTNVAFVPLEEWRQQQSAKQDLSLTNVLIEGQLYAIDGGIFKAKQQDGRWELWVWQGHNGNDVGTRTGFEVDGAGRLYDRCYDVEAGEPLVISRARFEVVDIQPIKSALEVGIMQESDRSTPLDRGKDFFK